MNLTLVQTILRGFALVAIFAAAPLTAQAVSYGGYIVGGNASVQLYLDGALVSAPHSAGSDVASLSGSNFGFGQGIRNDPYFNPTSLSFGVFNNGINDSYTQYSSRQGFDGPANYVFDYANQTDPLDFRNGFGIDISNLKTFLSGVVPISGTSFSPNGLTFNIASGSMTIDDMDPSDPVNPYIVDLAGLSGIIAGAGNGTYIQGSYSIPILADVLVSTPWGDFDAVFSTTMSATPLPEPGTLGLISLGLLATLPAIRRRVPCRRS